ncbi:MAG: hypothetical protein HUJ68_04635 [Clostridia bacterium]|nr:hypothetical protein [Clostridia bacterium]
MKKLIIVLLAFSCLIGCSKKQETEIDDLGREVEVDPVSKEEKILTMINECINDYNNNVINEKEIEWNTTIPKKPIEIEYINEISSLSKLKETKDDDLITNAIYVGIYDLDQYNMIFKIYKASDSFWLYGKVSFELKDINSIGDKQDQFITTKNELDYLLTEGRKRLPYLYGINTEKGYESTEYPGYYELVSMDNYRPTTIQDIKNIIEEVFSSNFVESYYESAFNQDSGIYKEINGRLYVADSEITIFHGLSYNTSKIVAIQENEDELLIDLLATEGEYTSPQIERIRLEKSEQGWRLDNAY